MAYDAQVTEKSADMIVLEKARERIARGWCQENFRLYSAVCIVGAFDKCGSVSWYDGIRPFAALLGFKSGYEAQRWNDVPGRTQAEVLAVFDAAIAKLAAAQ